jgi:hypothetical protein
MAIGKISGAMLYPNLDRQGIDLAFQSNLLYLDVTNHRVGIVNSTPAYALDSSGNVKIANIIVEASTLSSNTGVMSFGSNANVSITGGIDGQFLTTDGSGNLSWSAPIDTAANLALGTVGDGSLWPTGMVSSWTGTTLLGDAVDDVNECMFNIMNSTAVANVAFTADTTSGGAGTTVTLTIASLGNPNRYDINWGDGTTDNNQTDSTPTHTYSTNSGSPFTVNVRAYNNGGVGACSEMYYELEDYIVIYTADPVVTFAAYTASSGGSPITQWDDGDTVYFENTTTNTSGATVQYTWAWGDGSSDNVISSDASAGGVGGGRLAHTFTTSTEQEQTRTVTLTLDSHTTALPSAIPTNDTDSFKIYDDHTPSVTLSSVTGINEEGTSGLPITFTNATETSIGSYATYGIQYRYEFGDGNVHVVNTGSGAQGDTSGTIGHTYALSSGEQSSGTARDFSGNLKVLSNHSSSPFISSTFTVHVEPDVRATVSGTAVTTSDRSGDNQYDLYAFTDYNGNNRALVRATNTSQNADDYLYDWGDSTDDSVTEDGSSPGSIGATIDHSYISASTGNYNLAFTANGTPDLTAQTDTDTGITFTLNAVPSAPAGLSAKSITLSDSAQGTSPKLAHGFTDNSATNPLSAGASLNTTTARRYTSGTIDTSTVNNAYNGVSGNLVAVVNGISKGNKVFSTSTGENGTFTSLVVSGQLDAHDSISSSTYPTGFYQTFDAKITQALSSYSVGVNDERLEHSSTGNTNYVSVVYDDVTSVPSIVSSGTLAEGTGGTKRYISGIPYYNSGSPTVSLSGVQISNLTGQAYTDQSNIVEVDNATNQEGTSSAGTTNTDYTYSNIDGAVTMLSGGIPKVDIGVSSAYTIGALTVPITSSSVRTIDRVKVRARNANGVGSYSENTTAIQVHKSSQSGISEIAIAVSDSLGAGFDDDGVRIFDFNAATTDNPSYTSSTNFYTNSPYTEASDPGVEGTKEATIRLGVLKYDVTDYSSGYLPVGPDRSSDTGTQYFTFAFRRTTMANFDINITSSGIAGLWIAAPGTGIDDASGLNGWVDASITYGGSGVPGSDTGNGGNGSNGCAFTSGDRIASSTSLSGGYTMTLGSENGTNATGNVVLVRIALTSGQSVSALSVGVAS